MARLAKIENKEKTSMDDIDYVVCHSPYAKLVNKSFARAVSFFISVDLYKKKKILICYDSLTTISFLILKMKNMPPLSPSKI
jgi:hydroxymethylglutaryl-CoA synthase